MEIAMDIVPEPFGNGLNQTFNHSNNLTDGPPIWQTEKWPIEKWPIEKCINANILNVTQLENINQLLLYNKTQIMCLEHAPTRTKGSVVRACVLCALALLSFFGNAATIISISMGRKTRSRSRPSWTAVYTLILHLSVADILVTVFCIAGEAAWSFTVEWFAGDIVCKMFKFLQMFSLYLSTFVLVLIGLDRWLAVRYPMKSMGTATRSARLLTVAWSLSLVLSLPQAIIFRVAKGPFFEEFHQCVTHGFYTENWQEQLYISTSLLLMFILPLIILITTYVSTVQTIARSEKVFEAEVTRHTKFLSPELNRKKLIHKAKVKSLRISVVIVVAFVVWWTPYYVMMIMFTYFNLNKNQSEDLLSGIFFFGMSNSLVNPVIYGAFHLWPKKRSSRNTERDGESGGGGRTSLLRRGDTSSIRLTTIRSIRSSRNYSCGNGNNLIQLDGDSSDARTSLLRRGDSSSIRLATIPSPKPLSKSNAII